MLLICPKLLLCTRAHQKVELENARQEIITIENTKNEEMELVHARLYDNNIYTVQYISQCIIFYNS